MYYKKEINNVNKQYVCVCLFPSLLSNPFTVLIYISNSDAVNGLRDDLLQKMNILTSKAESNTDQASRALKVLGGFFHLYTVASHFSTFVKELLTIKSNSPLQMQLKFWTQYLNEVRRPEPFKYHIIISLSQTTARYRPLLFRVRSRGFDLYHNAVSIV